MMCHRIRSHRSRTMNVRAPSSARSHILRTLHIRHLASTRSHPMRPQRLSAALPATRHNVPGNASRSVDPRQCSSEARRTFCCVQRSRPLLNTQGFATRQVSNHIVTTVSSDHKWLMGSGPDPESMAEKNCWTEGVSFASCMAGKPVAAIPSTGIMQPAKALTARPVMVVEVPRLVCPRAHTRLSSLHGVSWHIRFR